MKRTQFHFFPNSTCFVVKIFSSCKDINEARLKLAKQLGATTTVLIGKEDTSEQVAKKTKKSLSIAGFDKTIECSGVESSLRAGIEVIVFTLTT